MESVIHIRIDMEFNADQTKCIDVHISHVVTTKILMRSKHLAS